MKKEGIQTRNRKLSSKGKRHRRGADLTAQAPLMQPPYEKNSSAFAFHSFPHTGFSHNTFQNSYTSTNNNFIPNNNNNNIFGPSNNNNNSLLLSNNEAFLPPSPTYREFPCLSGNTASFGGYFAGSFHQFSSRNNDSFCQLVDWDGAFSECDNLYHSF